MNDIYRKKLIQKYYSARANEYDRQKSRTWKSSHGFGNDVFGEILEGFKKFKDKSLLEVGIGSGRNAKPLLEKIKPHAVGLDLSKEMLRTATNKLTNHKQRLDLILGDVDQMPFIAGTFEGILCMSAMHYFPDQEKTLSNFNQLLKKKGILIYGDLSPHESDDENFFESLERTISKAHARYYKTSEMKRLIEKSGFHVNRVRTIRYKKSYDALIEDKGTYFDVGIETLRKFIENASMTAKKQYSLTNKEMTLFYSVVTATKEES